MFAACTSCCIETNWLAATGGLSCFPLKMTKPRGNSHKQQARQKILIESKYSSHFPQQAHIFQRERSRFDFLFKSRTNHRRFKSLNLRFPRPHSSKERGENVGHGSEKSPRNFCVIPRTWGAHTRGTTLKTKPAQGLITHAV